MSGAAGSVWRGGAPLLLASASPARLSLLLAAGLPVETEPSGLDERALESELGPVAPPGLARALAAAKAKAVAERRPGRVVVGADQVLEIEGRATPKPRDRADARRQLESLAGRTHLLHSASTVLGIEGPPADVLETARLSVRSLGPVAIDRYLDLAGDAVTRSAGGYEIEGLGIHLFESLEGSHSAILGLPLLPLLAVLRRAGLLAI